MIDPWEEVSSFTLKIATDSIKKEEWSDLKNQGFTESRSKHSYALLRGPLSNSTHDEALEYLSSPNQKDSDSDCQDYLRCKKFGATHDEIMQAIRYGVTPFIYSKFRELGTSHKETMEVNSVGTANIGHIRSSYLQMRNSGANHNEAFEGATDPNLHSNCYSQLRKLGFSHQKCVDVAKSPGLENPDLYESLSGYGIPHKQILDANGKVTDMWTYGYAREAGATHKEALEALNPLTASLNYQVHYPDYRGASATHKEALEMISFKSPQPYNYAAYRKGGLSHEESRDMTLNLYVQPGDWISARNNGVSHQKALYIHSKGINLRGYGECKKLGIPDNQILEAHNKIRNYIGGKYDVGNELSEYARGRELGIPHNELVKAKEKGIGYSLYNHLRDYGLSHSTILDMDQIDKENSGNRWLRKCQGNYISSKDYGRGISAEDVTDAFSKNKSCTRYHHARDAGATHDEALEVSDLKDPLSPNGFNNYITLRGNDITHPDALDVAKKNLSIKEYLNNRREGFSHEDTLCRDPDYDPWENTKLSTKFFMHPDGSIISEDDVEQQEVAQHLINSHGWSPEQTRTVGVMLTMNPQTKEVSSKSQKIFHTRDLDQLTYDHNREHSERPRHDGTVSSFIRGHNVWDDDKYFDHIYDEEPGHYIENSMGPWGDVTLSSKKDIDNGPWDNLFKSKSN